VAAVRAVAACSRVPALVLASALSFGLVAAITIVGALTLSYFILNMPLGRRENEGAAATFLRRALINATTLVVYKRNGGVRRYLPETQDFAATTDPMLYWS